MQEDIDNKTVAITVKATKLTGRLLAKAMMALLRKMREQSHKTGKQSIRSLSKQGASLEDMKIDGDNIGSFSKVARKYNVDFALKRDKSEAPPKWYVFFKAKDSKAITAAFQEYTRNQVKLATRKPSLLSTLSKLKDIVRQAAPPVKNRNIGGHEL